MGIFIKNRKLILTLLVVFGFVLFFGVETKAQTANCENFNEIKDPAAAKAACEATPANRCEWCSMPGTIDAKCRKKLEVDWPPSPSGITLSRCSTFTDFIRYFYEWGLTIGGLATFLSLLIAGVSYLTSVGKPEAMNQAKDRATSAIFGLLLLFGSWIILNTINPELTNFTAEPLKLGDINLFECDTDDDCVQRYCNGEADGCNFECGEPPLSKGDGTRAGLCIRKETEPEKPLLLAVVFKEKGFNGTTIEAPEDEFTQIPDNEGIKTGSVMTYKLIHEATPDATCATNCGLCPEEAPPGEASCKTRATREYNFACYWYKNQCLTNCGMNGCNGTLQLFHNTAGFLGLGGDKCGERMPDSPGYNNNLSRVAEKAINCVRLISPSSQ